MTVTRSGNGREREGLSRDMSKGPIYKAKVGRIEGEGGWGEGDGEGWK